MKKLLIILICLIMMLSLAACMVTGEAPSGDNDAPDSVQSENGQETNPENGENADSEESEEIIESLPEIDFNAILAGNTTADTVWGKQDEATKQQIIAEAKQDGVDVSFGADGSMTVVDPENGETIVQNPDGTWTIKGEDGYVGQYGGNWPENEFTKLLPKPDMELLAASENEQEFTVGFLNATVEQVKDYVEKVKDKGFTVDAQTSDQTVGDMVIYSYTAQNDAGYTVTVSCAMGVSAVLLEKP